MYLSSPSPPHWLMQTGQVILGFLTLPNTSYPTAFNPIHTLSFGCWHRQKFQRLLPLLLCHPEWDPTTDGSTSPLWRCRLLAEVDQLATPSMFPGAYNCWGTVIQLVIVHMCFNRFCTYFAKLFLVFCTWNITFPVTQIIHICYISTLEYDLPSMIYHAYVWIFSCVV